MINGTPEERAETVGGLGGELFMAGAILKGSKAPAERKILSTPEIVENKGTGAKSFLDARRSISNLIEKAQGMSQTQIGTFLESIGFKQFTPSGKPSIHYKNVNSNGKVGNLRVRLDIPDENTRYYHMHIEILDQSGKVAKRYDATLNAGERKSEEVHIKTGE